MRLMQIRQAADREDDAGSERPSAERAVLHLAERRAADRQVMILTLGHIVARPDGSQQIGFVDLEGPASNDGGGQLLNRIGPDEVAAFQHMAGFELFSLGRTSAGRADRLVGDFAEHAVVENHAAGGTGLRRDRADDAILRFHLVDHALAMHIDDDVSGWKAEEQQLEQPCLVGVAIVHPATR